MSQFEGVTERNCATLKFKEHNQQVPPLTRQKANHKLRISRWQIVFQRGPVPPSAIPTDKPLENCLKITTRYLRS